MVFFFSAIATAERNNFLSGKHKFKNGVKKIPRQPGKLVDLLKSRKIKMMVPNNWQKPAVILESIQNADSMQNNCDTSINIDSARIIDAIDPNLQSIASDIENTQMTNGRASDLASNLVTTPECARWIIGRDRARDEEIVRILMSTLKADLERVDLALKEGMMKFYG